MNNPTTNMIDKVLPKVLKVVTSKPITAIKDGFMLTMPLTIIGSVFLLIAFVPIPGYGNFMTGLFGDAWNVPLFQVVGATFDILALIAVFGIAYTYVQNEGHSGANAGILGIVAFLVVMKAFVLAPDGVTHIGGVIPKAYLGGKGMIGAIIIGLVVGKIYATALAKNWVIKLPEQVPEGVSNAFKSLIPGFVIITLAFLTYIFFEAVFDKTFIETIYYIIQTPLQNLSDSYFGALIVAMLISLLWWCGVHGTAIISGIMGPIFVANALQNQDVLNAGGTLVAGENAKIVTQQFIDQYITVGGAGLTFGLVICMLLFARSVQIKQIGKIALIPGLFNINEPVIFATPIIFNPIMLVPFLLAPMISVTMVYLSIDVGLVGPFSAVQVPWTTPIVLGGFVIGGWSAAALQVAVCAMTVAVYFPFFKYQDKLALAQEAATNEPEQEQKLENAVA